MIFSVNRQGALSNKPQTAAASLWEQLQQLAGDELSMEQLEQRLLQEAVERANGNLAAAARQLGLSRAQLAYRLQKR